MDNLLEDFYKNFQKLFPEEPIDENLKNDILKYLSKVQKKEKLLNLLNEILTTEITYKNNLEKILYGLENTKNNIIENLIIKTSITINERLEFYNKYNELKNNKNIIFHPRFISLYNLLSRLFVIDYVTEFFQFIASPTNYFTNKDMIKLFVNYKNEIETNIASYYKLQSNVKSILITPIQRGPRYELFLKEIISLFGQSEFDILYKKIQIDLQLFQYKCDRINKDKYNIQCINLYDTYNKKFKKNNILPSYCDRIFFKSKVKQFNGVGYDSYHHSQLKQSDHNMVYGKFEYNYNDIEKFKIIYITFNNGLITGDNITKELFEDMNKKMELLNQDIIILGFQEIQTYNNSIIKNKLNEYFKGEYELIGNKQYGMVKFQLGLFVFKKKTSNLSMRIDKLNNICFNNFVEILCSKAMIGYTLELTYYDKIFNLPQTIYLNLINTHLAFDRNNINLGYPKRREQLIEILSYLKSINEKQGLYVNIIAGDLNFRQKDISNIYDELYMEDIEELKGYNEPTLDIKPTFNSMPFNPTCKFNIKKYKLINF
jgi:hypothetical protein